MALKPLVFVPGLPGTEMRDAATGVQLFPNIFSLTSTTMRPKLLAQLSGPDDPDADDGVLAGAPIRSVIDSALIRSSFIDFSGTLKQADSLYDLLIGLGYAITDDSFGDRFRPVGWDWRRPVDQARVQRNVTAAITDLQRTTGAKVTVIAHSTGGLVMRSLLQKQPDLADRIERLIAIGVPWAGTLQSLPPLAALSGFGPLTAEETQRVLGRSWAAFDLLPPDPAKTDMTDGEGPLGFFTDAHGPASPLVSTGWIPPGQGFDALRQRAASADQRLGRRDRKLSPAALEVVNIAGWGASTLTGFRLDAGGGLTPSSSEEGDGTIPRRSVAWLQGDRLTTFLVPIGHTPLSQITDVHITLWENPAVRDLLGALLAGHSRPPYVYAAADPDDAVNVFGDAIRVRAVALDERGKALPGATLDAAGLRLSLGADGRGTLPVPRARITQQVTGDLFRLPVQFHWQGPGGPQSSAPQVLQVRKTG